MNKNQVFNSGLTVAVIVVAIFLFLNMFYKGPIVQKSKYLGDPRDISGYYLSTTAKPRQLTESMFAYNLPPLRIGYCDHGVIKFREDMKMMYTTVNATILKLPDEIVLFSNYTDVWGPDYELVVNDTLTTFKTLYIKPYAHVNNDNINCSLGYDNESYWW